VWCEADGFDKQSVIASCAIMVIAVDYGTVLLLVECAGAAAH
jgi:hypothetical protein